MLSSLEKAIGDSPWVLGYQKCSPIGWFDLFRLLSTGGK